MKCGFRIMGIDQDIGIKCVHVNIPLRHTFLRDHRKYRFQDQISEPEMVFAAPDEVFDERCHVLEIQEAPRSPEYALPMGHVEAVEPFIEQS